MLDAEVIVFSILQIVVFLLACSGNLVVVVVIVKYIRRSSVTIANKFIINLAVADMFTGLASLSQVIYTFVPELNDYLYSCLLHYQVVVCTTLTSQLLVTFTTFDRLVAICYPHKYYYIMTKTTANVLIFISWMYAFVVAFLPFVGLNHWTKNTPCLIQLVINSWQLLWMTLTLWIFTIVTIIMYALILRKACIVYRQVMPVVDEPPKNEFACLSRQISSNGIQSSAISDGVTSTNPSTYGSRQGGGKLSPSTAKTLSVLRGAKALAAITIVFTICWLPYTYFQFRGFLNPAYLHSKDWDIANWVVFLGMANSIMNPFIYAWQRRDFKMACKRILTCKGPAPTSQRSNDTRRAAF